MSVNLIAISYISGNVNYVADATTIYFYYVFRATLVCNSAVAVYDLQNIWDEVPSGTLSNMT